MARINTTDKKLCCGCGACVLACPSRCIHLASDEEGFDYPVISEEECVDCGKCLSVCGMQNKSQLNAVRQTFAAWHNNPETRAKGTSGSVFSALAEQMLEAGGTVAGARFGSDYRRVEHVVVNRSQEIAALRESKYVQSHTVTCFSDILNLLRENKKVLFSGCPCQVESLKRLVGPLGKELIACDFVCHGVPSPRVFKAYVEFLENSYHFGIDSFSFRDKTRGWNFPLISMRFKNGVVQRVLPWADRFFYGFSRNVFLRPCCYACPFARHKRPGDISFGDCWRVAASHPQYDDNKGTSLVLLNTEKGEHFFKEAAQKHIVAGEYDFQLACSRNKPLSSTPEEPWERNIFFSKFMDGGSFKTASDCFYSRKYVLRKYVEWLIKYCFWRVLKKRQ